MSSHITANHSKQKLQGRFISRGSELFSLQIGTDSIQVKVCTNDHQNLFGSWAEVEGFFEGEVFFAGKITILHQQNKPFPNPKGDWKWFHENESRRFALLEKRAKIISSIRSFFSEEGFLEVQTPAFSVNPGMDFHLDAFKVDSPSSRKWLITSPEYQMKRLLSAGFPKIYQLCKSFRKNELGGHHQPEFTMLEWYQAFADSSALMKQTRELIQYVIKKMFGRDQLQWKTSHISIEGSWQSLTVSQAFEQFASKKLEDILPNEDLFFRIFVEEIEPYLGFEKPVFLTHWPASMASLAQLHPQNPSFADRFELYIAGLELCNGFGELIDAKEQRKRFEHDQQKRSENQKDHYPIDEQFITALEDGLPPCSGNALGVDRLVMLLTNTTDIKDVVAFPEL